MRSKCDDVARLKQLETTLDRRFSLMGFRFGLDGLVGLVPGVGDLVTGALGAYLIIEARRLGASRWTVARMATNLGLDLAVGAVPVVGDVFDFAFKSNTKNIRLLIADLEKRAERLREVNREAQLKAAA
jgi:hypothetical protein